MFAAAIISILLAIVVLWKRVSTWGLPFALAMLAAAEWQFFSVLEIGALDLQTKILWSKVQYPGITTVTPFLLIFASEYSRRNKWLKPRNIALLFVIPAIAIILVATNELHGLIWSDIVPAAESVGQYLIYSHGPLFWLVIIHSYVLLVAATFLLMRAFLSFSKSQRRQVIVLIVGTMVPWIGNFIYISDLFPIEGLDITPLSFTVTGVVLAFSIFRNQLFTIMPIARDLIIENLPGGTIVLDERGNIVDINQRACKLINVSERSVVGKQAVQVLSDYPKIVKRLDSIANVKSEIRLDKSRYVDIRVSQIFNRRNDQIGRLIILRDITERKRLENIEHEQRIFAEALSDTAAAINSSLDVDEVFGDILENLERVVPHDAANIALVGKDGIVSFVHTHGYEKFGAEDLIKRLHFNVKDFPDFVRITVDGKPAIIHDTNTDLNWIPYKGMEWIRSYLGAPIKAKGKLLGFFNLEGSTPNFFIEEHAERLQAFADQAAIAIENAQLFNEQAQLADQMATLYEIGLAITSGLDLDQVLKKLNEQCKRFAKVDLFYLALSNEKNKTIEFPLVELKGKQYPIDKRSIKKNPGVTGYVITKGKTVHIADILDPESEFPAEQFISISGYIGHTYLGVPLIISGKVIGVLSIQSSAVNAYTDEQIRLLETIAAQASIAIENARLYARMEDMAITDTLTGLYNRRYILQIAEMEIARSLRYSKDFSMIMMDIDHFKLVNDTYGHIVGDRVLKALALNCSKLLRDIDIFGRYGGEEFIVLLPETDVHMAQNVAERLCETIEEMRVKGRRGGVSITLSLGVAELKETRSDLDSLLDAADKALYKAKQQGRNRVVVSE